jgi:hypothetical protein
VLLDESAVEVTSVANLGTGSPITVDPGPNQDQATITSVGTAGVNSALTAGTVTTPGLPVPSYTSASFLWNAPGFTSSAPTGTILVRRDFNLTAAQLANMTDAVLRVNVDDQYTAFVNGVEVASSTVANGWRTSQLADIQSDLVAGNNVIAIAPYNVSGAGGFIAALQMDWRLERFAEPVTKSSSSSARRAGSCAARTSTNRSGARRARIRRVTPVQTK